MKAYAKDPWGGTYILKDRPPDPPPPEKTAAEKATEALASILRDWEKNSPSG